MMESEINKLFVEAILHPSEEHPIPDDDFYGDYKDAPETEEDTGSDWAEPDDQTNN